MRRPVSLSLLVALVVGAPSCAPPPERYDLIFVGSTLIDGTGAQRRRADVGIRDGRIAAIGDLSDGEATERIDVSGLVVAPGFIDTHSHADEGLVDPALETNAGFLTQGVTTSVFGVDGLYAPGRIRELADIFERQGVGTNYAFYVGHNGVRRAVMGLADRAPTTDELERMKALVAEGMDEGAFGLSTGLMYLPGRFASTEEVVELARVAAVRGGVYDSHIRDPVDDLVGSVREALEIGAAAGAHAHPAHHKAPGRKNFGKGDELSQMIAVAIDAGQPVTVDQYPYDGAATARLVEVLVPPEGLGVEALIERFEAAESEEERLRDLDEITAMVVRALADPVLREQIRRRTESPPSEIYSWVETVGYDSFRLVASDAHPDWEGRMLTELAAEQDMSPFDLIARLIEEDGAMAKITLGACLEDDVRTILTRPWTMVASDGAITGFEGGAGHPRSRGTFPRVLGRYVREWKVLSLEEAVHKMTGLPAEFLGLDDRGLLAEGAHADVTVFDPESVIDRATWRQPALYSEGIVHVLVGGEWALRDGEVTGATPGRRLRPGAAR